MIPDILQTMAHLSWHTLFYSFGAEAKNRITDARLLKPQTLEKTEAQSDHY